MNTNYTGEHFDEEIDLFGNNTTLMYEPDSLQRSFYESNINKDMIRKIIDSDNN